MDKPADRPSHFIRDEVVKDLASGRFTGGMTPKF